MGGGHRRRVWRAGCGCTAGARSGGERQAGRGRRRRRGRCQCIGAHETKKVRASSKRLALKKSRRDELVTATRAECPSVEKHDAMREEPGRRPCILPSPNRRLACHWGHILLDRQRHWIECVEWRPAPSWKQLEWGPAPSGHSYHLQLSECGNRASSPRGDADCEHNMPGAGGARHGPGDRGRVVPRPRL